MPGSAAETDVWLDAGAGVRSGRGRAHRRAGGHGNAGRAVRRGAGRNAGRSSDAAVLEAGHDVVGRRSRHRTTWRRRCWRSCCQWPSIVHRIEPRSSSSAPRDHRSSRSSRVLPHFAGRARPGRRRCTRADDVATPPPTRRGRRRGRRRRIVRGRRPARRIPPRAPRPRLAVPGIVDPRREVGRQNSDLRSTEPHADAEIADVAIVVDRRSRELNGFATSTDGSVLEAFVPFSLRTRISDGLLSVRPFVFGRALSPLERRLERATPTGSFDFDERTAVSDRRDRPRPPRPAHRTRNSCRPLCPESSPSRSSSNRTRPTVSRSGSPTTRHTATTTSCGGNRGAGVPCCSSARPAPAWTSSSRR